MFLEIAIGAIGIGVVVMVGYLVVYNVRQALPTPYLSNPCYGLDPANALCTNGIYGSGALTNASATIVDPRYVTAGAGMDSAQTTIFAGFALVAVGIIVLAAFGLISVFK